MEELWEQDEWKKTITKVPYCMTQFTRRIHNRQICRDRSR